MKYDTNCVAKIFYEERDKLLNALDKHYIKTSNKPKPMKSVYNDGPKRKLNIKKHFESCSQSRFIKDK